MMFTLAAKPGYAIGLMTAALAGSAQARAADAQGIHGTWENPTGDVIVTTDSCGTMLCGWVKWASDTAKAEAREGGTPQLVGTSLLRNYKPKGDGKWQGQVFVPDMGDTFFSTIRQLDQNTIKISGCIMGGLLCKSQVWRRK